MLHRSHRRFQQAPPPCATRAPGTQYNFGNQKSIEALINADDFNDEMNEEVLEDE
jgi:hypothetical protein